MIHPKKVGHVVLKARDLAQVEKFYTEVLGFEVVMRLKQPRGVFFSLGEQHHDIAVLEVSAEADEPKADQVGLHHVALQVEDLAALKECYRTLQQHEVPIVRAVDHGITKSIYFCDPAGNRLELYCDVGEDGLAEIRRQNGRTIADFPPLNLGD
ncbi:MAG: VOC family protein [Deltaproteobacteria bacterium]|nr:VOC family protein [Deltaproteobacteria bacterium]